LQANATSFAHGAGASISGILRDAITILAVKPGLAHYARAIYWKAEPGIAHVAGVTRELGRAARLRAHTRLAACPGRTRIVVDYAIAVVIETVADFAGGLARGAVHCMIFDSGVRWRILRACVTIDASCSARTKIAGGVLHSGIERSRGIVLFAALAPDARPHEAHDQCRKLPPFDHPQPSQLLAVLRQHTRIIGEVTRRGVSLRTGFPR
jgi:hypothetical protein